MTCESRKNQLGVYKFYLGNEDLGHMVIGMLSDAEEYAKDYLEGVEDYLAHIDIFRYSLYVETIYKELTNE